MDSITKEIPFRVTIGVTACIAPILFVYNSFGAAIICLLLIIVCEFLIFEYVRGCNLFSNAIPIYLITEDENDIDLIYELSRSYKVLELILLSEHKLSNGKLSPLKSTDDIKNWLRKISYIPFYPSPRRFVYFSKKIDVKNFSELLEISGEYSIPLFKASKGVSPKQNLPTLNVLPVSFEDFEEINITSQEKSALTATFKNKRVCVCYDGRGSVIDLVYSLLFVNSIDLTICCESEELAAAAERILINRHSSRNYKIKISDFELICSQDAKPDVLFYSMPIKFDHSSEDNLKEAVIKNVLDTNRLIKLTQSAQVPFVFILSSAEASNARNWIGATLRLGELLAQFADLQSRKLHTKFRIIRIPNAATDKLGISWRIISSIMASGYVNVDFPNAELTNVYYRKDILPPLLKIITSNMKTYDTTSSVYTVIPEQSISLEDLIKKTCNIFCLRRDSDIRVIYKTRPETMDLEDFPNISESLEKTSIDHVFCTKFVNAKSSAYETLWSIEEINKMSTRDLISAIFQNLSEKIKR
jgi:hypothetical protein